MEDRFKFRFWHKPTKKMVNCYCFILNFVFGDTLYGIYNPAKSDDCILMQSTGLKDKNGKLIFEGDIVKRFHVSSSMQPSKFIGVVSYNNKKGRWEIEKNGKSDWFYEDDLYEVLGNIYENKELLDEPI